VGLGIGARAQSPIPNPQSPIPNPHLKKNKINKLNKKIILNYLIIQYIYNYFKLK